MNTIPDFLSARKAQQSRSVGHRALFWTLPEELQRDRIRTLAQTLSPETISTIVRRSVRDVISVIEAA